jgi:cell division FtsZ-interacting protein ZapD
VYFSEISEETEHFEKNADFVRNWLMSTPRRGQVSREVQLRKENREANRRPRPGGRCEMEASCNWKHLNISNRKSAENCVDITLAKSSAPG